MQLEFELRFVEFQLIVVLTSSSDSCLFFLFFSCLSTRVFLQFVDQIVQLCYYTGVDLQLLFKRICPLSHFFRFLTLQEHLLLNLNLNLQLVYFVYFTRHHFLVSILMLVKFLFSAIFFVSSLAKCISSNLILISLKGRPFFPNPVGGASCVGNAVRGCYKPAQSQFIL